MMGRRWISSQVLKPILAAGGGVALLLLAACGDEAAEEQGNAESNTVETQAVATLDPARAAAIQQGIEDFLVLVEGPLEQRIVHHGAVKVTAGSDAYDVTIEGVEIGVKGGDRMDVGTITYRLAPQGEDRYLASQLGHAPRLPVLDASGKETGSLALKTKSFTGEWSNDLQAFLALDWQVSDIVAADSEASGGRFTASAMSSSLNSTDKGSGLYDQAGQFALSGFSAREKAGGTLDIGRISGSVAMTGVKLKDYMAKTRELQALMAELSDAGGSAGTAVTATPPAGLEPAQAQRLGEMIKGMSGLIAGTRYSVDVDTVTFKEPDSREAFRLQTGNLAVAFAGLDAEKATVTLGIGHDGLVVEDPELAQIPLFQKLLPARGNLALTLSEVPTRELWQLIGDQFPMLVAGDQSQTEAAIGVMFIAMQQLLQEAPMKLSVDPSGLHAEILQADASGAF
ncbi:MAG: hypothetical protein JNL25_04305, partial [Rhodospirillaceae bacterium]|nr:hypothetical protein [Rhodospirillaceae bacterium]